MERRTAIETIAAIACARTVARLDHKVWNNSAARISILSTTYPLWQQAGEPMEYHSIIITYAWPVRGASFDSEKQNTFQG